MIVRGNKPGQRRNRELNGGVPDGWARIKPKILQNDRLEVPGNIKLFAVISTWNDADIIRASIQNCYLNGCERVYILDNDSSDKTQQVAKFAGATDIISYPTKVYDDDLRIRYQNGIVQIVTEEEKLPCVWWMVLDADEFPTTRNGEKIVDYLSYLNPKINTVGCDFIDLYPIRKKYYQRGKHPALCMDHGVWRRGGVKRYCQCGHWKHSLIKFNKGNWNAAHFRGNHGLAVERPKREILFESTSDLVFFHAPIRHPNDTYKRLQLLCGTGRNEWDDQVTNNQGAVKRWKCLDAIYAEKWNEVEYPHSQVYGRPVVGLALYPWRVLAPDLIIQGDSENVPSQES